MDITLLNETLDAKRTEFRAIEILESRKRDELDAIVAKRHSLAAQIEAFEELKEKLGVRAEASEARAGLPSPTDAIRDMVGRYPGVEGQALVNHLVDKVATKATNVRHMLRTTLSNMVKSGQLQKRGQNRYFLPEG